MARRWGRPRSMLLIAGVGVLALTPVMAGAAPLDVSNVYKPVGYFRFCAEAQLDIANISESAMTAADISIGGTIYESASDFEKSKSAVTRTGGDRILTVQWTQYRDAERTQPRMIRCKLRTGESLTKGAWPDGEENNSPGFEVEERFGFGDDADGVSTNPVDKTCAAVNQRTIDNVWDGLLAEGATTIYPKPTIVADAQTALGPHWLNDTPPIAINGSALEVKARSLHVPTTEAFGAAIKGAHYCTFVAPEYLRDVLLGDAPVA